MYVCVSGVLLDVSCVFTYLFSQSRLLPVMCNKSLQHQSTGAMSHKFTDNISVPMHVCSCWLLAINM